MKSISLLLLTPLLLILAFCSCDDAPKNAAEKDRAILDSLSFDKVTLDWIRPYTDSSIYVHTISSYNDTPIINLTGISVKMNADNARKAAITLRNKFLDKGCLIYISDVHYGTRDDEVTLIKSSNQFDILRVEETNGINHGLENEDVIKKLQAWNKEYAFSIISASNDMVEAQFLVLPENMDAFAREVYEFCPDVVEQGTETVEALAKEMEGSKTLYLWWD